MRIPNASTPGLVDQVLTDLYNRHRKGRSKPVLFDGSRSPDIQKLITNLPAADVPVPRAVLGQCIDVTGRPAAVGLSATPGRNIGVLASVGKDAIPMLTGAAFSLAGQYPGGVDLVLAPLVAEAEGRARWLADRFRKQPGEKKVQIRVSKDLVSTICTLSTDVTNWLEGKAGKPRPTLVVLYAADALDTVLERSDTEKLRKLLRLGPESGVHVLGWWRSIQRLRGLLTLGASVDDLGAWVALDVHGAELGPLVPGMQVSWAPRPGRGLFFDRAQHSYPEVIIVPSLSVETP